MRTLIALLLLLTAIPALAQTPEFITPALSERERIALANVGLTSLFTVARGVVEGRVRSVGDAAEAAAWGAVAGAGFYAAKDQVGRGRGVLGVGLAFASASLAENAATGGGPLGHVRVGFGPVDLHLRTPLATRPGPAVGVEVDPLGAVALVAVPLTGGRPVVRDGVLMYTHPSLGATSRGYTYGTTVGRVILLLEEGVSDRTVGHETIHLFQFIQASAVTPYGTLGSVWRGGRLTSHDGAVQWNVRTDWLAASVGGLIYTFSDYRGSVVEIEARELDHPPPGPPFCPLPPGAACQL